MKWIGLLLSACGLATAWFAFNLLGYIESDHAGSPFRNFRVGIFRVVHADPKMLELAKEFARDVSNMYSWMFSSALVLLGASALLCMGGFFLWFGRPHASRQAGRD